MKIHQLSLFLENQPGQIVEPCRILARAGIDIRTLTLADTQRFGILRLIVSDYQAGAQALNAAGFVTNVTEVVAVEIPDRPGGLAGMLELLDGSGVNIEYMYAFTFGRADRAVLISASTIPTAPSLFSRNPASTWSSPRSLPAHPDMSVSKTVAGQLDQASWIRRMFEEGARMRAERGADRVFDFTLGNPEVEPPPAVLAALRQAACDERPTSTATCPTPGSSPCARPLPRGSAPAPACPIRPSTSS